MSAAGAPPRMAAPDAADPDPWRAALRTAVALAPGRCSEPDATRLVALWDHVVERLQLGDGSTVAAVAGGTGVGKSALVKRLVGTEVVVEGVRRPTTDHPVAVTEVLDTPTRRLLDWLGIDDRRAVPGGPSDGLVLVDLPDHDSVAVGHRAISERLAARVDVLLVVVDPVKYARADLHEGALADLRAHAEVVTVVLNRTDELTAAEVPVVRNDLARRLEADGLGGATIITTSALTGAGVPDLRAHLTGVAAARRAARGRLAADAAVVAEEVLARTPSLPARAVEVGPLVEVAMEAGGAHRAAAGAEVGQRAAARRATRSPLVRLVRAPVAAAARLGRGFGFGPGAPDTTDRYAPTRSQQVLARRLAEEVDLAAAVGPSYANLQRTIEEAARRAAPAILELVRSVSSAATAGHRWWWSVLAATRGVAEGVALVGLAWLVLLGVLDRLGLPEPPLPQLTEALSWPAGLLLGGLATRVLLGLISRVAVSRSARRTRARTLRQLRERLAEVVTDHLVAPLDAEVTATSQLRAALTTLASEPAARSAASGRRG